MAETHSTQPPVNGAKCFLKLKSGLTPAMSLLLLALLWAIIVWGLWPFKQARLYREILSLTLIITWGCLWWRWSVVKPLPLKTLGTGIWALIVVAMVMPPFHSTDVFGYINRGWQQVAYHTNPYVTTISQLPAVVSAPSTNGVGGGSSTALTTDAMLTNHWIFNPCPYGFLFALIAWATCCLPLIMPIGKMGLVLVFKLTQLALLRVNVACLQGLHTHAEGGSASFPKANYISAHSLLWHPLVVVHGLANGHNDGWVGTLLLLAVVFSQQYPLLNLPLLLLAGWVKLLPLFALPLTFFTVWRLCGWRMTLYSTLLAGVLGALCAIPYVGSQPFQWRAFIENIGLSHNSLHAFITDVYQVIQPILLPFMPQYHFMVGWVKGLLWFGMLLVTGYISILPLLRPNWSWRAWQVGLMALLLGELLIASSKFHGWYLNMVLPLLWGFGLKHRWVRAVLLISLAQTLGVSFLGRAHIANTLIMTILPVVWIYRAYWLPKVSVFKKGLSP
jgi:alpha-1,6-mannosyltransferase